VHRAQSGAVNTKIARAVNEMLQPGGISLVQANGELAGQTVPHVHVHVLPRQAGDGLLLNLDRERTDQNKADSARIAEIAGRLRS
jgi:diadenosine tetraphosphate (Ap4A) HIT family hydrolase